MEAHYDQFIGLYPRAVSRDKCNLIISYFHELDSIGRSYSRKNTNDNTSNHPRLSQIKKDLSVNVANLGFKIDDNLQSEFMLTNVDPTYGFVQNELVGCINHYIDQYEETLMDNYKLQPMYHKIQKTSPAQGYHAWHHEQGPNVIMQRVLVYTLFLNDVEEGGETEFLWQHKRIPARAGDVCIFPAHFTHPHRGNTPLKGDKYIMTGWVESI